MFEQIFNTLMSEYGIFASFELLVIGALAYIIRIMWKKIDKLQERLLDTVENNTKVITQLVDKLENHD
jgi:hypothetical protein